MRGKACAGARLAPAAHPKPTAHPTNCCAAEGMRSPDTFALNEPQNGASNKWVSSTWRYPRGKNGNTLGWGWLPRAEQRAGRCPTLARGEGGNEGGKEGMGVASPSWGQPALPPVPTAAPVPTGSHPTSGGISTHLRSPRPGLITPTLVLIR